MTWTPRRVAKQALDGLLWRVLRESLPFYDEILFAIGQQRSRAMAADPRRTLREAEFRVFSQWGEDGIIQHLLQHVPIEHDTFVEIGVGNYRESNTRFLLMNNNWRGLIVDSGCAHEEFLERSGLRWRYAIDPLTLFVTRENVNNAIASAGLSGDIGILSIDIDGNDYWVWEAIEVVRPRIVVIEYNSAFGRTHAISVPYDPQFRAAQAHWSHLYRGASISALAHLGDKKGYRLVGSNSHGCNAFFVRDDVLGATPASTAREAYVESRFRDARDRQGRPSYVTSHEDRLQVIADMTVRDVTTGATMPVGRLR
jgi:hypothetical protein